MRPFSGDAARRGPLALVLVVLVVMLGVVLAAPGAHEVDEVPSDRVAEEVVSDRISGEDRFDTAANIAAASHPRGAQTALIATAGAFPDALASAGLARLLGAPLLLTERQAVPGRTQAALDALNVSDTIILGGTDAVSAAVEDELGNRRGVERVAGQNRFETAANIARTIDRRGRIGTTSNGRRTAFLASGESYPDALAAGPAASAGPDPFPILLTRRDSLHEATSVAVAELGIGHVLVAGGEAAVSDAVVQELRAGGIGVTRIAGANRLETAAALADYAVENLGLSSQTIVLVRGDDFPDALAAGPHAAGNMGPILLTGSPARLGAATRQWLAERCPDVGTIRAIGGAAAVSEAVLQEAVRAAEACHSPPTPPPTPVDGVGPEYYARWANGPPSDPSWFPIGVWMQDPLQTRDGRSNAENYRELGINTFVGLWDWPASDNGQLAALRAQGLHVIAGGWGGDSADAAYVNSHPDSQAVRGYLLLDEPDMALHDGQCILPPAVSGYARALHGADPTRPVYMNGGKGFALPTFYHGANCPDQRPANFWDPHPDAWYQQDFYDGGDYQAYYDWLADIDIPSVDYYAMTDPYEGERESGVWAYGRAVRRMRAFVGDRKPVWVFIEATKVWADSNARATPEQVKSIVWMSLIHGARGVQYFAHQFGPMVTDALLADPAMVTMIRSINAQIIALAPVLNSSTIADGVQVSTTDVAVDTMVKHHNGSVYIFAIGARSGATTATFTVPNATTGTVEVIGENRTLALTNGTFQDDFPNHGVHLYRLPG